MLYRKNWVEKNMGISRKTLTTYEEYGFIKPARNPENNKYREFTEEELERVWRIKFFVGLGYSLKEIKNMMEDPSFDLYRSIGEKLEELEEKKRELEQLIGHVKYIKATGVFPGIPKEMGTIKFEDFLNHAYNCLNVDDDTQISILKSNQMLDHTCSDPSILWSEEVERFIEKLSSKLETDQSLEDIIIESIKKIGVDKRHIKFLISLRSYWKELASLSCCEPSDPEVQAVVKKMYELEQSSLFYEYSDIITPNRLNG